MKIYLSGSYARQAELRLYALFLASLGHIITSSWLFSNVIDDGSIGIKNSDLEWKWATINLKAIQDSEALIYFAEPDGSTFTRGGRHTEFGMALAHNLHTWVIGKKEQSFHLLAHGHHDTWDEFVVNTVLRGTLEIHGKLD